MADHWVTLSDGRHVLVSDKSGGHHGTHNPATHTGEKTTDKAINNPAIEAARAKLEAEMYKASSALKAFPRGPTGLTPDDIKNSMEYKTAKQSYDRAFATLRKFNSTYKPTARRRG